MTVRTAVRRGRAPVVVEQLENRTLLAAAALSVVGNHVVDPNGQVVRLTGVNVPSLEWSATGEGPAGGGIAATVTESFTDWDSNIIRLPVRQTFWLASGTAGTNYKAKVDSIIAQAEAADKYVLLDLHTGSAIDGMPDDNSTLFWTDAATRYANNPSVLFGLYNEPQGVTWDVWKYGGNNVKGTGLHSPGMQGLLNTVRATGAKNVAVVGGLDWAYTSGAITQGFALTDTTGNGVVYDAHIYPWKSSWQEHVGNLAQVAPIIVGEIGHPNGTTYPGIPTSFEGPTTWMPKIMDWIDTHDLNFTGWAMYPDTNGSFPSLISDWSYTPTAYSGAYVKDHLNSYTDPASLRVLGGTVIGTTGTAQNPTTGLLTDVFFGAVTAFDMSPTRFPNAPTASGSWVGLDLGTPAQVAQVSFMPRATLGSRMVGGVFQGSNTADFSSGVVTLATVAAAPTDNVFTTLTSGSNATFRYVRYVGPANGWGNVADIKFHGYERPVGQQLLSQGKPTTTDSFAAGFEPSKAVDGNTTTRWQAANATKPHWLKVDLGSNQAVSQVLTYFLVGSTDWYQYKIETSTDNVNWTMFADRTSNLTPATTYYTDTGSAIARYVRLTVTGIQNPAAGAKAAEFQIFGMPLISQGKTASASSTNASYPALNALDRNLSTRWQAASSAKPQWLQVDLGTVHNVSQVQSAFLNGDTSYYRYKIETSTDGSTWKLFADRRSDTALGSPYYLDTGAGVGRYVRLTITDTQDTAVTPNVTQFEVFGSAYEPAQLVSQRKTATASSFATGFDPGRAVDASATTRWQAANATKPAWMQLDLGGNHAIRQVHTYFLNASTNWYQYRIEYSSNGTTWSTFADRTANAALGNPYYDDKGAVNARYLRLTVTGAQTSTLAANAVEFNVFGWSLSTPALISQDKTTTASSFTSGFEASRAVDGSTGTRWQAADTTKPQWLQVDLGANYNVTRIETTLNNDVSRWTQWKLEYSLDGVTWFLYADHTLVKLPSDGPHVDLGDVTARYVRLTITGTQVATDYASVAELKIFGV